MFWLWLGLGIVGGMVLLVALGLVALYHYLLSNYFEFLVRAFQEKPFFLTPRGRPVDEAEDVTFPTEGGLYLRGCYFHSRAPERRGVILFGLEFGSNRWACLSYCDFLLDAGYDVFSFEPRGQGESDPQPGYEPLHWVTNFEVEDTHAAIAYLRTRPDAPPRGIGFFGISKGGGAGLLAASQEPYVRCCVTDGAFATLATMVPFMRKFVAIVSTRYWLQTLLPLWFYAQVGKGALPRIERRRNVRYPSLERAMARLSPRPVFIIHGADDKYIRPEVARTLYHRAGRPKELWLVEGARHNQALQVAGEEYQNRVLDFFQTHLAQRPVRVPAAAPGR